MIKNASGMQMSENGRSFISFCWKCWKTCIDSVKFTFLKFWSQGPLDALTYGYFSQQVQHAKTNKRPDRLTDQKPPYFRDNTDQTKREDEKRFSISIYLTLHDVKIVLEKEETKKKINVLTTYSILKTSSQDCFAEIVIEVFVCPPHWLQDLWPKRFFSPLTHLGQLWTEVYGVSPNCSQKWQNSEIVVWRCCLSYKVLMSLFPWWYL